MAAGIQEHVHRALCIAAQDYRFLAHTGNEEVAWIWNLAFVADEQPCAGEQLLQLLAVQLWRDEDLAADNTPFGVDHRLHRAHSAATCTGGRPISSSHGAPFRYEA